MIVLAVIQIYSKFPALAIKLGDENAVAVLSLLSYTKLQRTVVTIMSLTELKYPDGVIHYVDADVKFFRGKHLYIYLGIVGILVFWSFLLYLTLGN